MADFCAHGMERGNGCWACQRDQKRGEDWAKDKLLTDRGFQREVMAVAKETLLKQAESRCKTAVMAAMQDRRRIERAIALGEGAWWEELAPLTPNERTVVLNQLKLQWNVRVQDVFEKPDAMLDELANEQLETVLKN